MQVRVEGQQSLNGNYEPSGNANAAIALMAAALLTEQATTIRNVPKSISVQGMLAVAQKLGAEINWSEENTLTLQTPQITKRVLSPDEGNISVSMILYLAAMLIRRQHARLEVDFPLNRIRTHLEALRDLGIDVITSHSAIECKSSTWEYKSIVLTQTSVTATALVMMLAACLGRETLVNNAACEPHIHELANMLCEMGIHIEGIGSNILRIIGNRDLQGVDVAISPDHIEAASIAAISAMSGGRVQINGIRRGNFQMIDKIYQRLGIQLDIDDGLIFVPKHESLMVSNLEEDVDSSIETAPWPGFPSDLVAIATVIATQARGTSLIHEKLFNNRLLFVDKLKAMGAQIVLCDPHRVIVIGPTPLHGIYMDTPDIRTGLGMLGAALIAEGESVIDNAQAIESNFAGALGKLQALGARITIE